MKIYIAGSSNELETVRPWITACKDIGLDITLDWTIPVEKQGGNPTNLPEEERQGFAIEDLTAVEQADIFWLLVPSNHTSRGCWVEFGYARAMALSNEIITIASGDIKVSIFTAVADYAFLAHQQAFEFIRQYVDSKKVPA